jgi:hypothetical protein
MVLRRSTVSFQVIVVVEAAAAVADLRRMRTHYTSPDLDPANRRAMIVRMKLKDNRSKESQTHFRIPHKAGCMVLKYIFAQGLKKGVKALHPINVLLVPVDRLLIGSSPGGPTS